MKETDQKVNLLTSFDIPGKQFAFIAIKSDQNFILEKNFRHCVYQIVENGLRGYKDTELLSVGGLLVALLIGRLLLYSML